MPTSKEPILMPEGKLPPAISPESEIVEYKGEPWAFYDGMPMTPLGHRRALPREYCHVEPGYSIGRCRMIKTTGERCRNACRPGWDVCRFHGAGTEKKPGGSPTKTGRHSKHLPTRFIEQYESFLNDPEYLNLTSEMALLDARMGELLTMLDGADTKTAWTKIRGVAYHLSQVVTSLTSKEEDDIDLAQVRDVIDAQKTALYDALSIRTADHELWDEIGTVVEQRRKLADTERRRILDARKYLTLTEANAMLAFVIDVVLKNVHDPHERSVISDSFRRLAERNEQPELAPTAESILPDEDDVIDMEVIDEPDVDDDIQESI